MHLVGMLAMHSKCAKLENNVFSKWVYRNKIFYISAMIVSFIEAHMCTFYPSKGIYQRSKTPDLTKLRKCYHQSMRMNKSSLKLHYFSCTKMKFRPISIDRIIHFRPVPPPQRTIVTTNVLSSIINHIKENSTSGELFDTEQESAN